MDEIQKLTDINTVSEDIFSVSQYLDVARLPDVFNWSCSDTLPVIDREGRIVGIVSEFDLAKVAKNLSLDKNSYQSKLMVEDIMTKHVWIEKHGTDVLDLFNKLGQMHTRFVPIVDDAGIYTGKCITRTKLINYLTRKIKPRTISGVATPLGVYLSDGLHQVGAKNIGLILNGIVFAAFIFTAQILTSKIHADLLSSATKLLMFLLFFKFSPMSQIHASEHKVINAIEKGLPLDIDTVKRQSRVHQRCGTNLLVLFLGIAFVFYVTTVFVPKIWILRFLISFVMLLGIFSYWKQLGCKVQTFFTTREPSDKQIEKAIKVGKDLLEAYKNEPKDKDISFLSLIYTSGTLQIIISFLLFFNILNLCFYTMVK